MAESIILELLSRRNECAVEMPEDIQKKIAHIKKQCQDAITLESSEASLSSWRKPNNSKQSQWRSGNGHGHGHGNGSGPGSRYPKGPVPFRGGGAANSQSFSTHTTPATSTTQSSQRYVSKFQNTENAGVDDKILHNVILSKLNKFSSANYNEVKGFLQQILDSDEKGFLKDFMLLVFKKAASETTFCPLYAKMLSELSSSYPVLLEEMTTLYDSYLSIFEEVTEEECKDYETFVKRNREKAYRLGYSQFLAELTTCGILDLTSLVRMYMKILGQIKVVSTKGTSHTQLVEEYVDCLLRMTRAFQKGLSEQLMSIRKGLLVETEPILTELLSQKSTTYPGISKKASFGLMDCMDILRA